MLTPWNKGAIGKLTVVQAAKKFLVFCANEEIHYSIYKKRPVDPT
jgi:hypothetical protein